MIINDYLNKWKGLNGQYLGGIPPEHIWNMDEIGIQMGSGQKNKGKRYFYLHDQRNRHQISSGNLELITVIECVVRSIGHFKSHFGSPGARTWF
jgi:hypothetical protein